MAAIPFDIKQLYKNDTGESPESYVLYAHISGRGNLIVDKDPDELSEIVERTGMFTVWSPEYVEWLENKVLKLIKK